MEQNKLKVNFVENKEERPQAPSIKSNRRLEAQASMERLWHLNSEKFDPRRDCMQSHRLDLTIDTIKSKGPLQGKRAADLGCGSGALAKLLCEEGVTVDCIDVATNALKYVAKENLRGLNPIHDCLPNTKLEDNTYDLVICTDVIPYLQPAEYRILMAELSRLVKGDGIVVVSTGLDIDTEDPLEAFATLGETEFLIDTWVFSYHRLLIKCLRFFDAPQKYVNGSRDKEKRSKELNKRRGLGKWWYALNTTPVIALCWKFISLIFNPISHFLRNSNTVMHFLDKISRLLWSEAGISEALFIGKKRPLTFPLPQNELPKELKHKRQMWT